jgi:hypothetical protein
LKFWLLQAAAGVAIHGVTLVQVVEVVAKLRRAKQHLVQHLK